MIAKIYGEARTATDVLLSGRLSLRQLNLDPVRWLLSGIAGKIREKIRAVVEDSPSYLLCAVGPGDQRIKREKPAFFKGEEVVMPPDDILMAISPIVERGDYTVLDRLLDGLTEDRYAPFCRKIRLYIKTYDDEGILKYIKEVNHE